MERMVSKKKKDLKSNQMNPQPLIPARRVQTALRSD